MPANSPPRGSNGVVKGSASAWRVCVVLLGAALLDFAAPGRAAVVINEIMYHPPGGVEAREYLELYNTGPTSVTLTDWYLAGAVTYNFPPGKTLAANAYLVVAKSVTAFHARYTTSTADVVGDYSGQLNNAGEEILLYDGGPVPVDRVGYGDQGYWPPQADGKGSSLELIHPGLDNSQAQSWAASSPAETPGFRNSRLAANPRPFLVTPRHAPAVPHTTDTIAVAIRAYDQASISAVELFYRDELSTAPFARAVMLDDGAHGDGAAGDGVYGALLPPQPQGRILEFWFRATDDTAQTTDFPAAAPTANCLLQVDNQDFPTSPPAYRIVMKAADHRFLHDPVNQWSNTLHNATFVCGDDISYNVGVRLRGKGSRTRTRKSYRVQFTEQEPFHGVDNLNLNAQWIRSQWLDMDLFRRAGMPAPATQFAYLVFKYNDRNTYYRYDGSPATEPNLLTMGWRLQMQDLNQDFLRQWFPGHSNGNLYRGVWVSATEQADLTYLGPNKDSYRRAYEKHGNEAADDFSDVIQLCNVFTNTAAASFTAAVARYIDPDEWMHFWAGLAMMNIEETDIYNTRGDDYFLYFDPATSPPFPRALLLPWDLDEANLNPTETIFACTLPRVNRFVQNPDYTAKYFYYIQQMLDYYYTVGILLPKIQSLTPYSGWETPPAAGIPRDTLSLAELTDYVQRRIAFLESVISRELTVNVAGATKAGDLYVATQPTVTLSGRGLTALTRRVYVNGRDAAYQHLTGNWGNSVVNLSPGMNTVYVECFTTAGLSAARKTLSIFYGTAPTNVCGTLAADTQWTAAGSPYTVSCDTLVPAGRTLRIGPGTIVLLQPGCSIFVFGTLLADGTAAQPVTFAGTAPSSPTARWGTIAFSGADTACRLAHCLFDGGSGDSYGGQSYGGTVSVVNSLADVLDCTFRNCGAHAVNASNGVGLVNVRRCLFEAGGATSVFSNGYATTVEDSTFALRTQSPANAIELRERTNPWSLVRNNRFLGSVDDLLVTGNANVTVESNVFSHAAHAALQLGSATPATLRFNVIHDCAIGVVVRNGSVVALDHNTLYGNGIAIQCRNDPAAPGWGGGTATVANTIVWSCATPLAADAQSTLAASYSDVAGGFAGRANFDLDPQFANPALKDFHVRHTSPCAARGQGGTYVGAYPPLPPPRTAARWWRLY